MIASVVLVSVLAQGKGDFSYKIGNQEFLGYVAEAKGFKKRSAVVYVVQDWNGMGDHEKSVADKLASLGYTAFAIDVYGKGVRPSTVQTCSAESSKYYANPELYMERMSGAIRAFSSKFRPRGQQIAIGYCFGGTGVLEFARRNLGIDGVVAFHGGLKRLGKDRAKSISARVLVLHGEADTFIDKPDIAECEAEMKVAKSYTFKSYPGAVHAFTVKSMGFSVGGAAYNEAADKGSWSELMKFLPR